jgi:hypothetical protein
MKRYCLQALHAKNKVNRVMLKNGFQMLLACLLVLSVPAVSSATGPVENQSSQKASEAAESAGESEEDPVGLLDRHKEYVDAQVQRAAMWVDSFFVDPNYEAEQANSQFRLRPELYYSKEDDLKARLRVRIRLNLPNMGRRVSLVAGAEDESDFDGSVDDPGDDGIVGLQFFMKESSRWNTSLSMGIKFNDFAGFVGPRVRYTDVLGEKGSYRFTQTLRWQTNNYWQINSRLDLNRVIKDSLFFRQTFDGRWRGERADEEGYRTQISSFLTQRLGEVSGLQYEFSTVFHTRPDTHVDKYVLAVRYRKRTSRDWLYYEIAPQVSFEEEFDYAFNPGVRLRLEFFYGAQTTDQISKRELEDSEGFRW